MLSRPSAAGSRCHVGSTLPKVGGTSPGRRAGICQPAARRCGLAQVSPSLSASPCTLPCTMHHHALCRSSSSFENRDDRVEWPVMPATFRVPLKPLTNPTLPISCQGVHQIHRIRAHANLPRLATQKPQTRNIGKP